MGTLTTIVLVLLGIAALAAVVWWIRKGRPEAQRWMRREGYIPETDQERAAAARVQREDGARRLINVTPPAKKIKY
jgi:hypothetical protein